MKLSPVLRFSVLAFCTLLLSACEGDARDLTEPVEAGRLNISSLQIVPPSAAIIPLTVNPDKATAFTLAGINASGQDIVIDAANRRWSVSNANIAAVNENGVFTGLQEGEVDVYALVGGVSAPPFTVDVSFGILSDIGDIEGNMALQPCLAQTYSTSGVFSDGSRRALDSVSWSVEPQESGTFEVGTESGSIHLSGTTSGPITLTATSNNLSGSRVLNIDNTLEAISLPDGLSLAANATLQLAAQGSYSASGENEIKNITDAVAWSITQGENQANVGNTAGSKGLVSGMAEGSAEVQANCGPDVSARTTLTITPAVTQLVADGGTDVNLSVGQLEPLRISTGSIYDRNMDVTRLATWDVVGVDDSVVSVSDASDTKGEVMALARGEVIVRATYNSVSINFTVDVN
ncbi:MAG: hypothetical protein V3U65_11895 [Granulosicoccaceae bacterium]